MTEFAQPKNKRVRNFSFLFKYFLIKSYIFIDTLTILLYNIIIKKEKDKTKMKESTLKKYNKTQLENYVNKAKEQVEFWQEQLELAEKVLVTKTKEKDFEDGLYIADAEKSSWFLVVVKDGEVTEVNNCNPLLNLYKIDPYRPLKIKLVKGQYQFRFNSELHTLTPLFESDNFKMDFITNYLLLNDDCFDEVTVNIMNYLSDENSPQVKFIEELTYCLNKVYGFNLHGDYYKTGVFQLLNLNQLKDFIKENQSNEKIRGFLHDVSYFYTYWYRVVNPQSYVYRLELKDLEFIINNLKKAF